MSEKISGQQIRDKFTQYFISKQHEKNASSSLIPHNDKTLLFCNAGMNQFKDYFTGKSIASNKRAVSIQKCVRAGGKHNDLENVGHTARHHTFFEMLGNFSFGDYFKEEAIRFAWEFLTVELKIPPEKLYVTVHYSDDEARKLWMKVAGLPNEKIFNKGDKDNFWEMGEFGPCGPSSEIFFDHGEEYTDHDLVRVDPLDLLEDEKRYVEIWNLVFMQFEKTPEGKFSLPKPSIDTGAGLERVTAALQGCYNNYNTDIFFPIMKKIEDISGKKYDPYGKDEKTKAAFRVVADHIRSATMLITDGAIPSNEGRGYVLRRIIRRAIKYLNELGVKELSFYKLVPAVFESLGQEYPQNAANAELAVKLLELEEKKFRETLENGLKFLTDALSKEVTNKVFSGKAAFKLYDTYGFPVDLTEMYLIDHGLKLDHENFDKAMKEQKELSKKSWKGAFDNSDKIFHTVKEKYGASNFVGYEHLEVEAKLLEIIDMGEIKGLIFDKTSFYGESGGQVGDIGVVKLGKNTLANISDTQKPVDSLHVHFSNDADALEVGKSYTLSVDSKSRKLIMRNHSATHLLQAALIKVLGPHVKQAGSIVSADKLRFDFTHLQAMTKEEIEKVEDLVNQEISKAHRVEANIMNMEEAQKKGAMALFGEKYGNIVRVLSMGDFSTELCGGVHVHNTSDIGLITVLSESSLATGVRRIEATTSETAIHHLSHRSQLLKKVESLFMDKEERALVKLENLIKDLKEKQKEIESLKDKIQLNESKDLFNNVENLGGIDYAIIEASPDSDLRKLSDLFISKFQNGAVVLYNLNGDKASVLVRSSKGASKLNAGDALKDILPVINGRGGGKPDMAQGSGEAALIGKIALQAKTVMKAKLG
ncbi:MAG: alanine--tRNA ligase [Bacteriovoracaceae bacterium]|nr:alanine--tRNA ligase [Bacteriovoracaceae bacterium]